MITVYEYDAIPKFNFHQTTIYFVTTINVVLPCRRS